MHNNFGGSRENRTLLVSILARNTRSPLLPPKLVSHTGNDPV
jgi:hypothetical protein